MTVSATDKQHGADTETLLTLRRIIENPAGGVIGLVDELVAICAQERLELDWRAGNLHVRSLKHGWEEQISVPLRKSVFRAILARVAALCNEHVPNSVSPYGGHGQVLAGPNLGVLYAGFVNTAAEQRLELTATQPLPENGK